MFQVVMRTLHETRCVSSPVPWCSGDQVTVPQEKKLMVPSNFLYMDGPQEASFWGSSHIPISQCLATPGESLVVSIFFLTLTRIGLWGLPIGSAMHFPQSCIILDFTDRLGNMKPAERQEVGHKQHTTQAKSEQVHQRAQFTVRPGRQPRTCSSLPPLHRQ